MTDQPNVQFAVKFKYDGASRIVDNITLDPDAGLLIGFEMRKSGKFSYKVKKYSDSKISNLEVIDAVHRSGPVVGRP